MYVNATVYVSPDTRFDTSTLVDTFRDQLRRKGITLDHVDVRTDERLRGRSGMVLIDGGLSPGRELG